jgi:hypothetical protein
MQVHEALKKINRIHDQLTRDEVYRGFRVPAVAAVGILGIAAALLQPLLPAIPFVWYWVTIAVAGGVIGSAAALHDHACHEDDFARRRTRRVLSQFSPCILAGGAITVGAARLPEMMGLLPGLWAIIFGLGVLATRPHLPPAIGQVGLGYVSAGAALLLRANPGGDPSPWAVGGVFGLGHLATAFVLWRERPRVDERDCDG